ncbi:MAG: gluconate 2-dehydrogenase subunit 3 family protein [Chitinophagaceae bacterium]|nr:gluconate 2-dehydrogenase subunit 3 family protein [Chitinophagaceae bacterium]
MKRRTAIRQLVYITGGTLLIPACLNREDKATLSLTNISVTGSQEKLVAELAETIIPQTTTPGAKAIGAPLFIWTMLNDCYAKEDQQRFMGGLVAFDKAYSDGNERSFLESDTTQRIAFLTKLSAEKDKKSDIHYFASNARKLTIQAYTNSKYFLTEVEPYELIPGRFKGCVPVQKNNTKKA